MSTQPIRIVLATGAIVLSLAGCRPSSSVPAPSPSPAATANSAMETWDAVYMQGSKVGTLHTIQRPDSTATDVRVIETEFHMVIERFGQKAEQRVTSTSWETSTGRLVRFVTESFQGPKPVRTDGQVAGDTLNLTTTRDGRTETSKLAWRADDGGFLAVEQSLLAKPMAPGEQRSVNALMQVVNLVGRCDLVAKSLEKVKLPTGERQLLRIEQRQTLPGAAPMDSTLWCDTSGEILKQRVASIGQEVVRTTRELAQQVEPGRGFDLGTHSSVITTRPVQDLHGAQRTVYHVTVKDAQAAELFPSGPAQQVRLLAGSTAEIIVRAVRPEAFVPGPTAAVDSPTDADRQPSSMIQSDDPRVVALAKSIDAVDAQPWQVATQLERLVHTKIVHKNLSQTFVSAAETLTSGEGDCTEHAVLLAALLRARGLPARTAAGLVYVDTLPGFAFHMWTEVYVGGQWLGVDGTLGRGGLGAGHLKLTHTSLENSAAITHLLPVIQVLGKLQIKIESVE